MVTPLPTPPSSSDPANFDIRADTFLGALPQLATDMQEVLDASYAAVAASIGTIAASVTTTQSLQATTGSKTIQVETGKAILPNVIMTFKKNSNAADSFTGTVASYNSSTGALVINATAVTGSSTAAAGWQGVITRVTPDTGTMMLRNEQAQNVGPSEANFAGATYFTRLLNTVVANGISGASLSNSQITLPAGTYEIYATAPAYISASGTLLAHKSRFRNVSDNILFYGAHANSYINGTSYSTVENRFSINSSKVFDLQTIVATPGSNGAASNLGGPEVYSTLTIRKVA